VLTITAYSDSIPVDIVVTEPPQMREDEDNEEQSGFAELLAGLMQSEPVSQNGLDMPEIEVTGDGNKLNILPNEFVSAADFSPDSLDPEAAVQTSMDSAFNNDFNSILSADHLFSSSLYTDDLNEDTNDFLQRFAEGLDEQVISDLVESESSNTDFSSGDFFAEVKFSGEQTAKVISSIAEKTKTDPTVQTNAAFETASERTINDDTGFTAEKKNAAKENNAVLDKNDKAEALCANNESGKNNEAASDKRNDNPGTSGEIIRGKLDEHRSRLRRDKVSFEVRDLRTASNVIANTGSSGAETAAGRVSGSPVQEITLNLRMSDHAAQNPQSQASWDIKSPAALENMLARELHQNFNGDIVRHASMILRNGGEGVIRLALHPETLGNVKIHLEMTDNKITGKIFVESQEALNAFRSEITELEQAFRDSGFADASLNLSLSADGAGAEKHEPEEPLFNSMIAASSYEDSYDTETTPVVDVFFGRKTGSVNMLA